MPHGLLYFEVTSNGVLPLAPPKSLTVKAEVIAAVKAFQTCKTFPCITLNLCKLCCVLVPDRGSVTQTIPASDFIDSPVAETTRPTITAPCVFVNARLFSV